METIEDPERYAMWIHFQPSIEMLRYAPGSHRSGGSSRFQPSIEMLLRYGHGRKGVPRLYFQPSIEMLHGMLSVSGSR